jgi:phosphatidylglycerol:prolipoprotein diacylglycerol transferase
VAAGAGAGCETGAVAEILPVLAAIAYDPLLRIPIGPLEVSPHGLMIAVGVLVGARYVRPAAERRGIDLDQLYDVLTWALVGALVGARVAYVVNHLGDYAGDLLGILRVWEGGFSLLGGLAGAVVAGYPKLRSLGIPFWRFMDMAVPGVALGIAVGRTGDLIIADHLGKRTGSFLGYVCPEVETGSPCVAPVGEAVHQTALYDMVGVAVVFAVLVVLARRPRPEGLLTLVFGVGYGVVRFVEGFFRIDVTHGTGLNGSQWTALIVGLAAAAGLLVVRKRRPVSYPGSAEPAPAADAADPDPAPALDAAGVGSTSAAPDPAPAPDAAGRTPASAPDPAPDPAPAPVPAPDPTPAGTDSPPARNVTDTHLPPRPDAAGTDPAPGSERRDADPGPAASARPDEGTEPATLPDGAEPERPGDTGA